MEMLKKLLSSLLFVAVVFGAASAEAGYVKRGGTQRRAGTQRRDGTARAGRSGKKCSSCGCKGSWRNAKDTTVAK